MSATVLVEEMKISVFVCTIGMRGGDAGPTVEFHCALTLQLEQVYPAMFSTRPRMGSFTFLQKLISLRTSAMATSCGVVMTIAPFTLDSDKYCVKVICSSEVPGGAVAQGLARTLRQAAPRPLTVDDEVIKFAPIHVSQKLLN